MKTNVPPPQFGREKKIQVFQQVFCTLFRPATVQKTQKYIDIEKIKGRKLNKKIQFLFVCRHCDFCISTVGRQRLVTVKKRRRFLLLLVINWFCMFHSISYLSSKVSTLELLRQKCNRAQSSYFHFHCHRVAEIHRNLAFTGRGFLLCCCPCTWMQSGQIARDTLSDAGGGKNRWFI